MPSHVLSVAAQSPNARAVRAVGNELTRRHLLAGAGAATLAGASTATAAPGNDAELLDLIQRLLAITEEFRRSDARMDALYDQLPSLEWTVEELTAHRIEGRKDRPRTLLPEDIERSDRADDPAQPILQRAVDEREDGYTASLTVVRPKVTAADRAAWRLRCRARRALYDAKHAARDEAMERLGINAGEKQSKAIGAEWYAIRNRIIASPAATVAGATAKMKASADITGTGSDADIDIHEPGLFVSALADLERFAGGAA